MDMQQNRNVHRSPYNDAADWSRARGILARSFYKELKANGLSGRQVLELSNELLQLVTDDVEKGDNW
jgi:hypothetical protein